MLLYKNDTDGATAAQAQRFLKEKQEKTTTAMRKEKKERKGEKSE